jgi:hypothetical protein
MPNHQTAVADEPPPIQTFKDMANGQYALCLDNGAYHGQVVVRRAELEWVPLSNPTDRWSTREAGVNKCRILTPGSKITIVVGG